MECNLYNFRFSYDLRIFHYSLFTIHYSPFTIHHSLFTIHNPYSLTSHINAAIFTAPRSSSRLLTASNTSVSA
ncbi:hypothetical protein EGI32_11830 [Ferruginibacter sp. HRS2-29]|nr:hypothetical protein [Ferruginibacter sp. HRS2-29]